MSREEIRFICCCWLLILVSGQSLDKDKQALLDLKVHLLAKNRVRQGPYASWNQSDHSPCNWSGIACDHADSRVVGIDLSESNISGDIFANFSLLTELAHLDLSSNTIGGPIPADLSRCSGLTYLNLSNNLIEAEFDLAALTNLVTLDLTRNRLNGSIGSNFPALCSNLVSLNISANDFVGDITGCFDQCAGLKYLDLSSNHFIGQVWHGFASLREFSVSENNLTGEIWASGFASSCDLEILDLSANKFSGAFPSSIANCSKLTSLNLWGNEFAGTVPSGIGSLSELEVLNLGKNQFDSDIPEELLNCSKLVFLDFSKCNFSGNIQEIFGRFKTVNYLILEGNSYTGGIESSGILALPDLVRIDLSSNLFWGQIPVAITAMPKVKILILAYNSFSGNIPPEIGRMTQLQLLDLSYNNLTGEIPRAVGNLTSLLWLMLANNNLSGVIPTTIGNCKSLLWLNLANNQLSGSIPPEITTIGSDPFSTFDSNRREMTRGVAGSGECLAMKRWIPASYPPFNFIYVLMTRSTCRTIWDRLLKGYGIFPICTNSTSRYQSLTISGYLQLSGNQLSGVIPQEIRKMTNVSLIHLDANNLSGQLPPEISELPLVVLNISDNMLSGEIPSEIGSLQCLSSLDLSQNNLSGKLPESLNGLSDLNMFNVSYNPLLSGEIPLTGQLATFEHDSFIGDPLISFAASSVRGTPPPPTSRGIANGSDRHRRVVAFWVFLAFCSTFLACGVFTFAISILRGRSVAVDPYADSEELDPEGVLLDGIKRRSDAAGSSSSTTISTSSAASNCSAVDGAVRVFTLERGARECAFTYNDIVAATRNFDEQMVVGRGGHGVVYRAVLPGGREVAVKKLQRNGRGEEEEDKGEREFKAEMEVMAGSGHPNLVTLHGWCLTGTMRLLVYDYMERGTLDEVIEDREGFGWERRLVAATGVARALAFLHHECTPAVVHRDVKASNVLLDGQGNARVTDFGLARAVAAGNSHVSTVVAGTVGYVAPEYGHTWRATTRGDVYSYGVLAMELATGRRALDGGDECLVERVRRAAAATKEELGLHVVGVREGEGTRAMLGLLKIGLRCAAEAPPMRPNMREVVEMLVRVGEKSEGKGRASSSPNWPPDASSASASSGRRSNSERFFPSQQFDCPSATAR